MGSERLVKCFHQKRKYFKFTKLQIHVPVSLLDRSQKIEEWKYLSKYSGKVAAGPSPSKRQSNGKQQKSRSRSSSDERKSSKSTPGAPSIHYQVKIKLENDSFHQQNISRTIIFNHKNLCVCVVIFMEDHLEVCLLNSRLLSGLYVLWDVVFHKNISITKLNLLRKLASFIGQNFSFEVHR